MFREIAVKSQVDYYDNETGTSRTIHNKNYRLYKICVGNPLNKQMKNYNKQNSSNKNPWGTGESNFQYKNYEAYYETRMYDPYTGGKKKLA